MRALFCVGLAALALGACGPAQTAPSQGQGEGQAVAAEDQIVNFGADDAEMNAAIAAARKTLPVFWNHLRTKPGEPSSLKVGLATSNGHEHIWVSDIEAKGDTITGRLANDPDNLPGLKLGSPVTFTRAQISDWAYEKNGKLYGHYTTRIVIKHIDPAEAAQVRAMLSENPVESDAS
ncbi:YegJ family protein [Caulobacter sp. UNC279MFTsu5.1]|uniref:YegJ family protein n=1 Tax=Caulobacter sp. UNC279MFTsu5.1 TaxID=1502775 RepID=UPI0008ECF494|nr:DUF2314 domain-containing protein [Caulobacter sp. UNC279MFTsu5.1]SFK19984.1 Uncharacterized conserved protein YegJ, DUF2314 family [Caulobacter sp. UNC279MFTsu5.1]